MEDRRWTGLAMEKRAKVKLLNDTTPMTHRVTEFCEIRIPEDEVDHFEEHPEELGQMVLDSLGRHSVVVIGVIYEED